jgi:hypothetical protein
VTATSWSKVASRSRCRSSRSNPSASSVTSSWPSGGSARDSSVDSKAGSSRCDSFGVRSWSSAVIKASYRCSVRPGKSAARTALR